MKKDLICLAEIVGVHGIKGMLKLKVFSEDPKNLMEYMPLCSADGKEFTFLNLQPHKNIYLTTLEGLSDRTEAEKLRGTKLYTNRDRLPKIEDEGSYYHADLVGLAVKSPEGEALGKVLTVENFGAGDLLEIKPNKGLSFYIPFNDEFAPEVNIEKKEVTIIIPLMDDSDK